MEPINPRDRQWLDAEEMVGPLERDQLVADRSRPVSRAELSRSARAALWWLRVFVVIVGAMVIYTFFAQL
ncbi:MAG TPA: hypothetical protein VGK33_18440 [Chloroflexota bacterium]|jgi:hypothetical protein